MALPITSAAKVVYYPPESYQKPNYLGCCFERFFKDGKFEEYRIDEQLKDEANFWAFAETYGIEFTKNFAKFAPHYEYNEDIIDYELANVPTDDTFGPFIGWAPETPLSPWGILSLDSGGLFAEWFDKTAVYLRTRDQWEPNTSFRTEFMLNTPEADTIDAYVSIYWGMHTTTSAYDPQLNNPEYRLDIHVKNIPLDKSTTINTDFVELYRRYVDTTANNNATLTTTEWELIDIFMCDESLVIPKDAVPKLNWLNVEAVGSYMFLRSNLFPKGWLRKVDISQNNNITNFNTNYVIPGGLVLFKAVGCLGAVNICKIEYPATVKIHATGMKYPGWVNNEANDAPDLINVEALLVLSTFNTGNTAPYIMPDVEVDSVWSYINETGTIDITITNNRVYQSPILWSVQEFHYNTYTTSTNTSYDVSAYCRDIKVDFTAKYGHTASISILDTDLVTYENGVTISLFQGLGRIVIYVSTDNGATWFKQYTGFITTVKRNPTKIKEETTIECKDITFLLGDGTFCKWAPTMAGKTLGNAVGILLDMFGFKNVVTWNNNVDDLIIPDFDEKGIKLDEKSTILDGIIKLCSLTQTDFSVDEDGYIVFDWWNATIPSEYLLSPGYVTSVANPTEIEGEFDYSQARTHWIGLGKNERTGGIQSTWNYKSGWNTPDNLNYTGFPRWVLIEDEENTKINKAVLQDMYESNEKFQRTIGWTSYFRNLSLGDLVQCDIPLTGFEVGLMFKIIERHIFIDFSHGGLPTAMDEYTAAVIA